jgi:hypothetical protein
VPQSKDFAQARLRLEPWGQLLRQLAGQPELEVQVGSPLHKGGQLLTKVEKEGACRERRFGNGPQQKQKLQLL